MRKLVLVVLLIAAVIYFLSNKYMVQSGSSPDGKYHLVLIDKKTGELNQLMGGK